jgi:RES domain-containing protein
MEVCPNCFDESKALRDFIESEGVDGNCPTCGTKKTKIIEAAELTPLFEPLAKYYEVAMSGEHYIYDSEDDCAILGDDGELLHHLLQDEWPIFSDSLDEDDMQRILDEVWPHYDCTSGYVHEDLWYISPDEEFRSMAKRLMHERRFFPKQRDPEPGEISIERLLDHRLEEYSAKLEPLTWFRSRLHETAPFGEIPEPFAPSVMGAPPKERLLRGGRANPAGIAYLYLASSIEAVVAEARSIRGDYVSVGSFAVPEGLSVIDLASKPPTFDPFAYEDLRWEIERRSLLREFGRRLSQPIQEGESELGYVITQYLVEFIASRGYDGIIYPSAVSEGKNLVLFDPKQANCTSVVQYRITKVDLKYKTEQIEDAYRKNIRYYPPDYF